MQEPEVDGLVEHEEHPKTPESSHAEPRKQRRPQEVELFLGRERPSDRHQGFEGDPVADVARVERQLMDERASLRRGAEQNEVDEQQYEYCVVQRKDAQ